MLFLLPAIQTKLNIKQRVVPVVQSLLSNTETRSDRSKRSTALLRSNRDGLKVRSRFEVKSSSKDNLGGNFR
jgi:hypothetical protein